MSSPMQTPQVYASALISTAIILSTLFGTQSFLKAKSWNNTISVTGSSEKLVTSDMVKWSGHFMRQVDVVGLKSGAEGLKSDVEALKNWLGGAGIPSSSITTQPLSLRPVCKGDQPNYDYQSCGSNQLVGYTMDQSVMIESDKVDVISPLTTEATSQMLSKNATFVSDSVEYYFTKLSGLKLELLAEATKNAKSRADEIVKSTGSQLGSVRSADTGVFQVTPVNSVDISDYGSFDTSSKEKKVTAVVHATFGLE